LTCRVFALSRWVLVKTFVVFSEGSLYSPTRPPPGSRIVFYGEFPFPFEHPPSHPLRSLPADNAVNTGSLLTFFCVENGRGALVTSLPIRAFRGWLILPRAPHRHSPVRCDSGVCAVRLGSSLCPKISFPRFGVPLLVSCPLVVFNTFPQNKRALPSPFSLLSIPNVSAREHGDTFQCWLFKPQGEKFSLQT